MEDLAVEPAPASPLPASPPGPCLLSSAALALFCVIAFDDASAIDAIGSLPAVAYGGKLRRGPLPFHAAPRPGLVC